VAGGRWTASGVGGADQGSGCAFGPEQGDGGGEDGGIATISRRLRFHSSNAEISDLNFLGEKICHGL